MDSAAEILMSTRELGCRRANFQSQRYLDKLLGQLDLEKHVVEKDWDRRMKTLVIQTKRRMPNGWDHTKTKGMRPKSAWTGYRDKNYVISRPETATQYRPMSPSVPEHWQLKACFKVTKDGKRIQQPLPDPQKSHLTSGSAYTLATNYTVKPRRAISAPVRRSGLSNCLITQLHLGQIAENNKSPGDDNIDNKSGIRPQSAITSIKIKDHERRTLTPKPRSGHVPGKRTQSPVNKKLATSQYTILKQVTAIA